MRIKTKYEEVSNFNKVLLDKLISKLVKIAVNELNFKNDFDYEVSILLTDNKRIRDLNHKYRNIRKETNVLAFPQKTSQKSLNEKNHLLGDIVISLEKIKKEAKIQSKEFHEHFVHILLHGLLHLLGYDHMKKNDANEMESKEIKILSKLLIKNPYLH